jgi:hypothetical protein
MDGTDVWPRISPGGRPAVYVTRDAGKKPPAARCGEASTRAPALKNKDRNAAFPIDRMIRVPAGALYDWSENTRVGFGFQQFNVQNARLNNDAVKGEYDWNDIFFLSFNVNWEKLPWNDWGAF